MTQIGSLRSSSYRDIFSVTYARQQNGFPEITAFCAHGGRNLWKGPCLVEFPRHALECCRLTGLCPAWGTSRSSHQDAWWRGKTLLQRSVPGCKADSRGIFQSEERRPNQTISCSHQAVPGELCGEVPRTSAMAMSEKEQLRLSWMTQFNKAQQHDSWGQVVEAQEDYQSMAAQIAAKQGLPTITSKEKDILHRLALCLGARAQALRTMHENITVTDMKCLVPIFEALFTGTEPEIFPVDASKYQFAASMVKPSTEGEIICADAEDESSTDWHQRQAVLRTVRGTVVCFRIEKIGLKDAQEYIDPFMTVLVADARANILDSRDTNFASERRATHVMFNQQVYLNVSLEDMERSGAAIFFEFKHYKPKKKKISTRCWAFMELTELKRDEEIVLEIYHKPTDLKKKKLNLHSEKPLYLHLFATFISN
eukprot:s2534_g13.t1